MRWSNFSDVLCSLTAATSSINDRRSMTKHCSTAFSSVFQSSIASIHQCWLWLRRQTLCHFSLLELQACITDLFGWLCTRCGPCVGHLLQINPVCQIFMCSDITSYVARCYLPLDLVRLQIHLSCLTVVVTTTKITIHYHVPLNQYLVDATGNVNGLK